MKLFGRKPREIALKVERAAVEPGDVIVISTDETLTMDARERIREQVESLFPSHKAALLEKGMKLTVAGPDAESRPVRSAGNPGQAWRC